MAWWIMCAIPPELAKECFRQTGSEGQGKTTVLEFLLRQALIPTSWNRRVVYSAIFMHCSTLSFQSKNEWLLIAIHINKAL